MDWLKFDCINSQFLQVAISDFNHFDSLGTPVFLHRLVQSVHEQVDLLDVLPNDQLFAAGGSKEFHSLTLQLMQYPVHFVSTMI